MVKLKCFARFSKVAVIDIPESKLDELELSSEVLTEHYDLIRFDRNTHGSGVVCVIRNGLSHNPEPSLFFFMWLGATSKMSTSSNM